MKSSQGIVWVFGALLVVTLAGILVHQATGYSYPVSSPAMDFELNVLGDIYEAAVLAPLGVLAIVAVRKGSRYAPILITFVTVHFTYNYAMAVTGRQNLWIFVWIAKLALSAIVLCLVSPMLPAPTGLRRGPRLAMVAYLALVVLAFSGMMGERLWASASGHAVDMTMQQFGSVDWGDPVLRDPVVFFSMVVPAMAVGITGLLKKAAWGTKAAAASFTFTVSIVSVIMFTGPLKEFLMTGSVSAPMRGMSGVMLLAATPAAGFLTLLTRESALY